MKSAVNDALYIESNNNKHATGSLSYLQIGMKIVGSIVSLISFNFEQKLTVLLLFLLLYFIVNTRD